MDAKATVIFLVYQAKRRRIIKHTYMLCRREEFARGGMRPPPIYIYTVSYTHLTLPTIYSV